MLLAREKAIIKKLIPLPTIFSTTWLQPKILYNKSSQSSTQNEQLKTTTAEEQNGTEYSNWILARSAKFNHDVSYLKRRYGRDRYNIHKLTNIDFMRTLVNRQQIYSLNLNQKIVLLAQMNHICNVLRKDKGVYGQFNTLIQRITKNIQDPDDYICVGTFMNVLVDLGDFSEMLWVKVIDALLVKKYDEQYDELFGLYSGLYKYKLGVEEFSDYMDLQKNKVIYTIPIIYRNSLEVIRQYVRFNTYNLKQCRLLFRSLHHAKINQKFFWKSVNDWFNIFIKEQLSSKDFQQFFIVPQSSIEKMLFDDGMIRPRSVLQQVSEIAFILSEHGFISQRYIEFIQTLIVCSIEKGSQLFIKFLDIEKAENSQKQQKIKLNEHINIIKDQQAIQMASMEKKYKTIFVNPTEVGSQSIIHILTVIKRALTISQDKSQTKSQRKKTTVDGRVMSWLVIRLCQPKMLYTVNELLKIIDCSDLLKAMKVNIRSLVLQKIKNVRQKNCTLMDLKDIFHYLPLMQFESISYILQYFLFRAHPKDILQLTKLFERQSMSPQDYEILDAQIATIKKHEGQSAQSDINRSHLLPKQKNKRWMPYLIDYFLHLPKAVNYHQKYYSFDQNCYFLYLLLKNGEYWQSKINYEYLGEMQKLKHSIKIATYSRGFKMQMGSYFYKLLNYVDLVSFFDGG